MQASKEGPDFMVQSDMRDLDLQRILHTAVGEKTPKLTGMTVPTEVHTNIPESAHCL